MHGSGDAGPDEREAQARAPRRAKAKRRRRGRRALKAARAVKRARELLVGLVKRVRASRGWRAARRAPRPLLVSLVAGLLLACYSVAPTSRPARAPAASETRLERWRREEPRVRVALVDAAPVVTFVVTGAWRLEAASGAPLTIDGGLVTVVPAGPGLEVRTAAGAQALDAPEVVARPVVEPGEPVQVGGRRYHGRVVLRRAGGPGAGAVRLVNHVGIEDYLAGVIGHEMPIGWEDAALHAQSIAARTYALASLRPKEDHDLKADVRSQVYRGVIAEDARARSLVEATRGMVLVWRGDIFTTFFHSTCGGDTVPADWIFGGQPIEPLQGATDCACQPSRLHRWTRTIDLRDPRLRSLVLELPLREVAVEHWPRGGYAKAVRFVDAGGGATEVAPAELRRLVGLESTAFELALGPGGTSLEVRGRGWGHGVGLCQFGANGFAKRGKDAAWILARAYPGSTIEALGYAR